MKRTTTVMAMVTLASGAAVAADAAQNEAMLKLAGNAGCMTCHQLDPGGKGPDGMAPIGPAWRDVSGKYHGQKDAAQQLTTIVQTGSNPYESHWKSKASGHPMPPSKVAIGEADTKKLVAWILALDPMKR